MQDLRFAFRMLFKHPLSNLAIVVTLGFLVGVFGSPIAFLRARERARNPFPQPERIVDVWHLSTQGYDDPLPMDAFQEIRRHARSFEAIGAGGFHRHVTFVGHGRAASVLVGQLTSAMFRVAGMPPSLGRYFSEEEERSGLDEVAVVSHRFWKEQLGGDPAIIGQSIHLDDQPCTVVGVMPAELEWSFLSFGGCQVLTPYDFRAEAAGLQGTSQRYIQVKGRLKEGVGLEQAQAEVMALGAEIERRRTPSATERKTHPGGHLGARALPMNSPVNQRGATGAPDDIRAFQNLVRCLALCVVLIACSNITNLLIARHAGRSREIGIRLSLGSSRTRLMRQLLVEMMILGALAGVLGLVVASSLASMMPWIPSEMRPRIGFDVGMFLSTLAAGTALGLLVGVLPAWRGTLSDLTVLLKRGGSTTAGREQHRLRNLLVSAQFTLAFVLCVAAGLVMRSFVQQQSMKPAFQAERTLTVNIQPRKNSYPTRSDFLTFARRQQQTVRELAGIQDTALILEGALFLFPNPASIDLGSAAGSSAGVASAMIRYVSPNFLELTGARIQKGQGLSPDLGETENEAIVDETFAQRHFPGRDPLGQQIRLSPQSAWLTVVGVAADRLPILQRERSGARLGEVYANYGHAPESVRMGQLVVFTRASADSLLAPVRTAIQSMDPSQTVPYLEVASRVIAQDRAGLRDLLAVLTTVAAAGLFLALVGIYALISHVVVERTREVGIRSALGAGHDEILRMFLKQGMRLCSLGLVPGLLLAAIVARIVPPETLPGFDPRDPWTYAVVAVLLGGTAWFACCLPARRAARVDPMVALRAE